MDNGLKYRDLQIQIDDRIYEFANKLYDEQKNKNFAEMTEDQAIELVKTEFENDQDLEDLLQLHSSIMATYGRSNDAEQALEMFYYTSAMMILNALERRYTGYMVGNHQYCSPTRHPRIYSGLNRE